MIYNLQYKTRYPKPDGNTYTRKITAGTDAEAWEQGLALGRSGYRLIAATPAIQLVDNRA